MIVQCQGIYRKEIDSVLFLHDGNNNNDAQKKKVKQNLTRQRSMCFFSFEFILFIRH